MLLDFNFLEENQLDFNSQPEKVVKQNKREKESLFELKQYSEFIHEEPNSLKPFLSQAFKDGESDNIKFIETTELSFKNKFNKENFFSFDDDMNFGLSTSLNYGMGIGFYRGDYTGIKKINEKHNFGKIKRPYILFEFGGELTTGFYGNEKFKPEIGIRTRNKIGNHIYYEIDGILKLTTKINNNSSFSIYGSKSLKNGFIVLLQKVGGG